MSVVELNESNFDETIKKGKVLVDFNADWCGPCRMLAPTIEKVSNNIKNVTFASFNIDESDSIPNRFGVYSIPCLILFDEGKEIKRSLGLISESEVEKLING